MDLQNLSRNELIEKRDNVVKQNRKETDQLRMIRRMGFGLSSKEWEEWDAADLKMNIALAPLDHMLYFKGYMF